MNLTNEQFVNVTTLALTANTAQPALWFTAAGGLVLVLLASMELLDHWRTVRTMTPPLTCRRRHAGHVSRFCATLSITRAQGIFLQIIGKLVAGFLLVGLTALESKGGEVRLDDEYYFHGSRIWKLAINSWL